MKLHFVAFTLLLPIAPSAFAEQGLVIHFTIQKTAGSGVDSYTNGVLMRLTEKSTQSFPGQYEISFDSKSLPEGKVNLVLTLKDISSGQPVYAGSGRVEVKVGGSANVPMHGIQGGSSYAVSVDTSYGELPSAGQR